MHQWDLAYCMGRSLGSATTVVSIGMKLQSIVVAVKHHAPTDVHITNRKHQSKTSSKNRSRRSIFHLYKMPLAIYKVF